MNAVTSFLASSARKLYATIGAIACGATIALVGTAHAVDTPVSVDGLGVDISATATNFGTQLGLVIVAVLGVTMGIAVIKVLASWFGAKRAK